MFATRSGNQTVFETYADGVNLGIATHLMGHEQHDAAFIGGIKPGATSLEAILDELNKKIVRETKAGINNGEYNNYSTLSAAYLSANGDLTIGWAGDSPIKLEIRNPKTGEIRNMNIEFEGHTNGRALVKFCDPGIVTDFEFKHSNIQTYLDYGSQIWGIDASEVQFSVNAESDGITEDHLPLLFKDRAARGKDFILDKYAPNKPENESAGA